MLATSPLRSSTKHLQLQWKKIDNLVSRVGGSANIFYELFGYCNSEETFWLDSSSTDQVLLMLCYLLLPAYRPFFSCKKVGQMLMLAHKHF